MFDLKFDAVPFAVEIEGNIELRMTSIEDPHVHEFGQVFATKCSDTVDEGVCRNLHAVPRNAGLFRGIHSQAHHLVDDLDRIGNAQ